MKKRVFCVCSMLILILVIGILPLQQVEASKSDFAVLLRIPESQQEGTTNYFDLLMEPSQEQVIEVELQNNSEAEIRVSAQICTAITNQDGVVEYGNSSVEADSSLRYVLDDLVTAGGTVAIPAHGTHMFQLTIRMPAEEFDGQLAGGVLFRVEEGETTEGETGESQAESRVNTYSHIVAILLRQNENAVSPQLRVTEVSPERDGTHGVIQVNIQNTEAAFADHVTIDAYIYQKGSNEVLSESHAENLQMAPNSNFDYRITLDDLELEAGEYTLQLEITSENSQWTLEEDMTIGNKIITNYFQSDDTIPVEESGSYVYAVLIVLGIVVASVICAIILFRRKQRREEAIIAITKSLIRSL